MRRIYGVTLADRVRSEAILENLGATKLSDIIRRRRMGYFGHVYRYPDKRWAKYLLYAKTTGQINMGRKTNWIKQIENDIQDYDLDVDILRTHGEAWANEAKEKMP